MDRYNRNPYGLDVVDATAECWCGICVEGDCTVVCPCEKHGVTEVVLSNSWSNDSIVLTDLQKKVLSVLTPEDYD